MENKKILTIIGIIIGIILVGYFINRSFTIYPSQGTSYNSFSVTKDSIIYSSLYENINTGFTDYHVLSGDNNGPGFFFPQGSYNRPLFKFYLEMNGIPSDTFSEGGSGRVSGVFKPINVNFPQCLQGDGTYENCCWPNPLGDYINQIQALGFVWNQRCYWAGDYKTSVFNDMANNMECYVSGQTTEICAGVNNCNPYNIQYNILGVVSYMEGNGFVCKVDKSLLFDEAKKIKSNVDLIRIDGTVLFQKKVIECTEDKCEGSDYYSCENNKYVLKGEVGGKCGVGESCQGTCENETTIQIYRLENNECKTLQILPKDKKDSDYLKIEDCNSKIIIEPGKEWYYRFSNEQCNQVQLSPSDVTSFDYKTLEDCQSNLNKPSYLIFILVIIGIIVFISFLIWFYIKTRR